LEKLIVTQLVKKFPTWSLTPREEHRLRVLKNRALRKIFEPKTEEVEGGWRKLHNYEF
jgi:hypothetical protein